jgi:hypothetical protein
LLSVLAVAGDEAVEIKAFRDLLIGIDFRDLGADVVECGKRPDE